MIKESLYVDDFISSASDVENTFFIPTSAKHMVYIAGMELCKWTTNCSAMKEKWKTTMNGLAPEIEANGSVLKDLGLVWRTETDFVFDLTRLLDVVIKGEYKKKHSVCI